ncbi:branched-chain amino acid ABC transporter ATP-binding protein/permease [Futiania mangrovi]|uniref:Branched-chain amino acid ABC transporter ATP-binding protein/permease n=1 Tax=Futiania mangrovi TaxID=2959716 RepID=A0A9J6P958_9PROT|nr:branched-chain amino acid ABC transporter ATP-binding protein/permease [Futiania mangrovii]MCP1335317.1 branched-chain amino acid ABC transporter ATP-binding protein/permease [Futiania mangrovii]
MDYLLHILVMVCFYAILATSFNLLIGFAGLFALSHAAFYAFGAYATAIATTTLGLPFPLPLLLSIVVAGFIGVLIALPALRVAGEYLVVVSLALQIIAIEVFINWKEVTGGTDGISGVPKLELFGFGFDSPGKFLILAVVMAVFCFWVATRLARSPFGRALRAMRENESAAQAVGKNILYMKVSVFAVSASLAAIAGWMFARYFSYVGADSFTIDETIYILAMVILGGTGNLWGSVLGAAILVILPELLKFIDMPVDIADKMRLVMYGVVLVLILRFRPEGMLPEPRGLAAMTVDLSGEDLKPAREGETFRGGSAQKGEVVMRGTDLKKTFGGITAVSHLSIELKSGWITGLIGPNGAGKTTAFNLLTGFLKPTGGEIELRGRKVENLKPHQVVGSGVARSFQDLRLFTKMTVIENVIVALPGQSGDNLANVYFRPWAVRAEEHENAARAMEILRFVDLDGKAHETAENLSYAEEKLLVVARLLATGAEVLLFDEPLSGLDRTTLQEIFPVIRKLAENGKTICIIEHNLDVIKELCDVVYFLDEGHAMAIGTPDEVMNDPELATRYFK